MRSEIGTGLTKFPKVVILYTISTKVKFREKRMLNPKKKGFKKEGIVTETLPSLNFRVKLDSGEEILAHLAGKLRIHRIKILSGDRVTVEISPYDEKKGRIIYRGK